MVGDWPWLLGGYYLTKHKPLLQSKSIVQPFVQYEILEVTLFFANGHPVDFYYIWLSRCSFSYPRQLSALVVISMDVKEDTLGDFQAKCGNLGPGLLADGHAPHVEDVGVINVHGKGGSDGDELVVCKPFALCHCQVTHANVAAGSRPCCLIFVGRPPCALDDVEPGDEVGFGFKMLYTSF